MRRRLLTIASALSMLLCVAMVVLWVQSYLSYLAIGYWFVNGSDGHDHGYFLGSSRSRLLLVADHPTSPALAPPSRFYFIRKDVDSYSPPWLWDSSPRRISCAGFSYEVRLTKNYPGSAIFVPYWFLLVLLLSPVWVRLKRALKRRAPGICVCCGYDLRATPDRCPECGAVAPVATNSASI